ncbi:hypothetical protein [Mucilaginibacter sp.]|uniref:hypothetical protein n=1 Tax=Mucilaginibacter sp. TaxID=1882438 RepID=UPI003263F391
MNELSEKILAGKVDRDDKIKLDMRNEKLELVDAPQRDALFSKEYVWLRHGR